MFGRVGWSTVKIFNSFSNVSTWDFFLQSNTFTRKLTTGSTLYRHPGIIYPKGVSKQWAVRKVLDCNQYTVAPLPLVRTGGRGPDGRIQLKHVTTGLRRPWFMVDFNQSRHLKSGQVYEELVLEIKKNWWRHPYIALVASGEVKRWILATTSMKVDDIIRFHANIPLIPVDPKPGDVHPIGALPVGTMINQIELDPGEGAERCRSAGASATIIRRGRLVGEKSMEDLAKLKIANAMFDIEDEVVVRDNSNRKLLRLLPSCMVVIGQVSNEHHSGQKFKKFGEKKWRGIKQRSGLWQRKTGRFGRKIKPVRPPVDYISRRVSKRIFQIKCTVPGLSEFKRNKDQKLFGDMHPDKFPKIQPEPKQYNSVEDSQPRFRWCTWSTVR